MGLLSFGPCRKRSLVLQKMDAPEVEDQDLNAIFSFQDTLDNLVGSQGLLSRFLKKTLPPTPGVVGMLDLFCASGKRAAFLSEWALKNNIDLKILGVESFGRMAQMARETYRGQKNLDFDARPLTHPSFLQGQQVDYVISLFSFNRLSYSDSVLLVKKARFLARKGILFIDWRRELPAWLFVNAVSRGSRSSFVRQEAKLFVERAYTLDEFKNVVSEGGGDVACVFPQAPFCLAYWEDRAPKAIPAFAGGLAGA